MCCHWNAISLLGCSSFLVHHKIEKCDCLGLMLTISHFLHTWSILELSVKKPCLHPVFGPPFTPYPLFQWYPQSKEIFIKSQYEMLKLSIQCTRFETNYSSSTVTSSANIYSSSEGARGKGKTRWNSVYHQNWWFSEFHIMLKWT